MKKVATILTVAVLIASCSDAEQPESVSVQNANQSTAQQKPQPQNNSLNTAQSIDSTGVSKNPFGGGSVKAEPEQPQQIHDHVHASEPVEQNTEADYTSDNSYQEMVNAETDIDSLYGQAESNTSVTFRNDPEAGVVQWNAPTEIAYRQADVLISGPSGKTVTRSFKPGQPIVLDEQLPDGVYSWESVITPEIDSYAREEMRQVREHGNIEAEQELLDRLRSQGSLPTEAQANENRQSGTFTVQDGVARPNYVDDPRKTDQDG